MFNTPKLQHTREDPEMKSQIFDQDTGQAGPDTQGVPDEWFGNKFS